MTLKEYQEIELKVFDLEKGTLYWRWELLKALWDIAKALNRGEE